MKKTINKIKRLLEELEGEMKKLNVPHKVIEKGITNFGNSSHIVLPKQYAKKKAYIIIKK